MTDSENRPLELEGVTKRFGSLRVLDGLSLSVEPGEVFGFLGRNGAGKSTAIRLAMGITRPDRGTVRLFGKALQRDPVAARRRVGYVAQEQNMYPWMTPRALGRFVRGFYPSWDEARWRALNETFALPPKRRLGTFSGGMKAKLALAFALATRPELLILDEPTAGMDPVARREFLDLVREEATRKGTTTFFSTHLVDEIDAIADRIAIVEAGRSVYQGPLAPLRRSLAGFSIANVDDVPGTLPGSFAGERLRVMEETVRGGRRRMVLQFGGSAPEPAPAELAPGWRVEPLSLEDVFVAVVSHAAQEARGGASRQDRDARASAGSAREAVGRA